MDGFIRSTRNALALFHPLANHNIKKSWRKLLLEACLEHQTCERQRLTQSFLGGPLFMRGTIGRFSSLTKVSRSLARLFAANIRSESWSPRGQVGVLESSGSDSDASCSSPAWADSPKQPQTGKRKQVSAAKGKSQRKADTYSDSSGSSPAWADSPQWPQATKCKQTRRPKRTCQRRPKSSSSSGAWSESKG